MPLDRQDVQMTAGSRNKYNMATSSISVKGDIAIAQVLRSVRDHPEAIECLQRKQLVSLCKRCGLKANGKNVELVSRLQEFAIQAMEEPASLLSSESAPTLTLRAFDQVDFEALLSASATTPAMTESAAHTSSNASDDAAPLNRRKSASPKVTSLEKASGSHDRDERNGTIKPRTSRRGRSSMAVEQPGAVPTDEQESETSLTASKSISAAPSTEIKPGNKRRSLRASLANSESSSTQQESSSEPERVIKPRPSRKSRSSAMNLLGSASSVPTSNSMVQVPVFPLPVMSPVQSPTATNDQFSAAASKVLAEMNARLARSGAATVAVPSFGALLAGAQSTPATAAPLIRAGWGAVKKNERFGDAHKKEFGKMDSIAHHYAAKRARPTPTATPDAISTARTASGASAKSAQQSAPKTQQVAKKASAISFAASTSAAMMATGRSARISTVPAPTRSTSRVSLKATQPPKQAAVVAARRRSSRLSNSGDKASERIGHSSMAKIEADRRAQLAEAARKRRQSVGRTRTDVNRFTSGGKSIWSKSVSALGGSKMAQSVGRVMDGAKEMLGKEAGRKFQDKALQHVRSITSDTAGAAKSNAASKAAAIASRKSTLASRPSTAGKRFASGSSTDSQQQQPPAKKRNVFDLKASLARKPGGYKPYSAKEALEGLRSEKTTTVAVTSPQGVLRTAASIRAINAPSGRQSVARADRKASGSSAISSGSSKDKELPPLPKVAARPRIDREKLIANRRAAVAAAAAGAARGAASAVLPRGRVSAAANRKVLRKSLAVVQPHQRTRVSMAPGISTKPTAVGALGNSSSSQMNRSTASKAQSSLVSKRVSMAAMKRARSSMPVERSDAIGRAKAGSPRKMLREGRLQ